MQKRKSRWLQLLVQVGAGREKARSLLHEGMEAIHSSELRLLQKLARELYDRHFADVDTVSSADGLTSLELQVLRLITKGHSDKDIGRLLFISRKTASNHVSSILSKTGSANRAEAAVYAERNGIN